MSESQNIQALSNEELLNNYRKEGNPTLLEELFGRHIRFVFLVCMKYLHDEEKSKDAAMQVFEKVLADIKRFEIQNFKSWLHVVTKNYCLMQLRSEKNIRFIPWENEKENTKFVENEPLLHHENNRELKLTLLQKAIDMLELDQKKCIELFYLKEKSYKEVSELTGFTMNEVKSYIQNGKRNLKNFLVSNGDILLYVFLCIHFNMF